MNTPSSPPSDEPEKKKSSAARGKKATPPPGGNPPGIATIQVCLAGLSRLPSLITLGMVTPGQAGAIRSAYAEILRHHERQQGGPSRTGVDEKGLIKVLKERPDLASLLEPVLTTEQIAWLMQGGDANGTDAA